MSNGHIKKIHKYITIGFTSQEIKKIEIEEITISY